MLHFAGGFLYPPWYCVFWYFNDFLFIQLRCEAIFAGRHCYLREIFELLFKFKRTRTLTIFGDYGILALDKYTIMAKPIKSLEFHYPMIQFLISRFIIWQTQSLANPCALTGSFLVRILQYGPFPWKRSNPYIFVLEQSRQIQNLQQRQRKKKCENCHSSHWNYQQKQERLKFFRNFKDGWRRRTFFKCKPTEVHFTIRNRVPYNKILTNRAYSGRNGDYFMNHTFSFIIQHPLFNLHTSWISN